MDYFQQQSPNSEPESSGSESSYSARNAGLFKQEPSVRNSQGHLSLNDYIARHLNKDAPEEPEFQAAISTPIFPRPANASSAAEAAAPGQFLNSLDVDMGAALEQYLPTPAFRFRVMKKRLDGDIEKLQTLLNKYQRLPHATLDLQQRIEAIQHRLGTLRAHQHEVNTQLSKAQRIPFLFQQSETFSRAMSAWFLDLGAWLRQGLLNLRYGKAYLQFEQGSTELQALQELFAERIQAKNVPNNEISELFNRYERVLHQTELAIGRLNKHLPGSSRGIYLK